MRRSLATVVVLVVIGAGGLLAACGGSSSAKTPPTTVPTDLRGKQTVEIDARGNQFTPTAVIVDVGTKVTWRNTDPVVHNVKKSADAVDFGAKFGTDSLPPGGSYSFTFTKVGTFPYECTIHAGMTGRVQVVAK